MTRAAVRRAAETLAAAGVETPRVDAELLAAHVLEVDRSQLGFGAEFSPAQLARYQELVAERATRVPLQHLTGEAAFRYLTLTVGPGVFVPRPETEALVDWGLARLVGVDRPQVLDLCAGSGAIALSVAYEVPRAHVCAVELDELAIAWLRRNNDKAGGRAIEIRCGDATEPATFAGLHGIDLVLSNPPYIPVGSLVAPEAAEHDPAVSLWGGDDGLLVVRKLVHRAASLLRPGGWFGFEHGEQQSAATASLLRSGGWSAVEVLPDLAGRPRFTVGQWVNG